MDTKTKRILAIIAILALSVSLIVAFSESLANNRLASNKLARVALLGDSITQITNYPADLQRLLGNSSVVDNFGVSGSSVNFYSSNTYFFQDAFRQSESFLPTTVIIMLGTNDARGDNYLKIDSFVNDYEIMINNVQNFVSKPQIFIVEPPPIYNNTISLNGTDFAHGVIPRIQQVADTLHLPLVDVYTSLLNHPEYFPDGVHPNKEGAQVIANVIYEAIRSSST